MTDFSADIKRVVNNWWVFLIAGILLLAAGSWVVSQPETAYAALTMIFVLTFIVHGVLEIFYAVTNRKVIGGGGGMLVFGIFEFLLGVLLWLSPSISILVLSYYVGVWLLLKGLTLILASLDLDDLGYSYAPWFVVGGVLTIVFAMFVILHPAFGAATVVAWTAISMFVAGIAYVCLAFVLRKAKSDVGNLEQRFEDHEKASSIE